MSDPVFFGKITCFGIHEFIACVLERTEHPRNVSKLKLKREQNILLFREYSLKLCKDCKKIGLRENRGALICQIKGKSTILKFHSYVLILKRSGENEEKSLFSCGGSVVMTADSNALGSGCLLCRERFLRHMAPEWKVKGGSRIKTRARETAVFYSYDVWLESRL